MLKEIKIKNYRGIKDLHIKDFKRINLLVGENSSGKTSVLEAVALSSNYNISGIIHFENFREKHYKIHSLEDPILWNDFEYLFYKKNFEDGFEIVSEIENENSKLDEVKIKCILTKNIVKFSNISNLNVINQNQNNSLVAEYSENGEKLAKLGYSRDGSTNEISNLRPLTITSLISSSPVPSGELMLNMRQIVESNGEAFLSNIAQEIDPKIKSIKTSNDRVYADIGPISVPLKYMGDGLSKVLHILLIMKNTKNGILLIDEIENGIHWKTQRVLWRALLKTAFENNVQIIATTHSRDTIEALTESWIDSSIKEDEISVFQLYKKNKSFVEALDIRTSSEMIKNNYEIR